MNDRSLSEWIFFRDMSGQWCWEHRVKGITVLESEQAYATRQECLAAAESRGFDGLQHAHKPLHDNYGDSLSS